MASCVEGVNIPAAAYNSGEVIPRFTCVIFLSAAAFILINMGMNFLLKYYYQFLFPRFEELLRGVQVEQQVMQQVNKNHWLYYYPVAFVCKYIIAQFVCAGLCHVFLSTGRNARPCLPNIDFWGRIAKPLLGYSIVFYAVTIWLIPFLLFLILQLIFVYDSSPEFMSDCFYSLNVLGEIIQRTVAFFSFLFLLLYVMGASCVLPFPPQQGFLLKTAF